MRQYPRNLRPEVRGQDHIQHMFAQALAPPLLQSGQLSGAVEMVVPHSQAAETHTEKLMINSLSI